MARISFLPAPAPFEVVFKQDVLMHLETARLLDSMWNISRNMRGQVSATTISRGESRPSPRSSLHGALRATRHGGGY